MSLKNIKMNSNFGQNPHKIKYLTFTNKLLQRILPIHICINRSYSYSTVKRLVKYKKGSGVLCSNFKDKTLEIVFFPIVMKLNNKEYRTARIPF